MKSWNEIKKKCEKILQSPANVEERAIKDAITNMESFIAEHAGTDEAAQADKYRTKLQGMLQSDPKHDLRLEQARVLVDGDPADVDKGVKILEQLLAENPEDDDVCETLLATARNYSAFETAIREIIQRMAPNRMVDFRTRLVDLEQQSPVKLTETLTMTDLKQRAEDAYYSGQWNLATVLMEQMLEKDPFHAWALEHIEKARVNRTAADIDGRIPGDAKQLYRRARSLIIARQYDNAGSLLKQAISIAEKSGTPFPRADELLESMDQVFAAQEFKTKLKQGLQKGELSDEVFNFLDAAIRLDDADDSLKLLEKEMNEIKDINYQVNLLFTYINSENAEENFKKIQKYKSDLSGLKHSWLYDVIDKAASKISTLTMKTAKRIVEISLQASNQGYIATIDIAERVKVQEKARMLFALVEPFIEPESLTAKSEIERKYQYAKSIESLDREINGEIKFEKIGDVGKILREMAGVVPESKNISPFLHTFLQKSLCASRLYWQELSLHDLFFTNSRMQIIDTLKIHVISPIQQLDADFDLRPVDDFIKSISGSSIWINKYWNKNFDTKLQRKLKKSISQLEEIGSPDKYSCCTPELRNLKQTLREILLNADAGITEKKQLDLLFIEIEVEYKKAKKCVNENERKEFWGRQSWKIFFVFGATFFLWMGSFLGIFLLKIFENGERTPPTPAIILGGFLGALTISTYELLKRTSVEYKDVIWMFIRPLIGAFFALFATTFVIGMEFSPFQNFFSQVFVAIIAGLLLNQLLVFFETISVSDIRGLLSALLSSLSNRLNRAENKFQERE